MVESRSHVLKNGRSKNTKQKKMAAVKDKMQCLKKADFTEKTKVANLGYKNPLKQGVILFFFLGGTICIALMEIN